MFFQHYHTHTVVDILRIINGAFVYVYLAFVVVFSLSVIYANWPMFLQHCPSYAAWKQAKGRRGTLRIANEALCCYVLPLRYLF